MDHHVVQKVLDLEPADRIIGPHRVLVTDIARATPNQDTAPAAFEPGLGGWITSALGKFDPARAAEPHRIVRWGAANQLYLRTRVSSD